MLALRYALRRACALLLFLAAPLAAADSPSPAFTLEEVRAGQRGYGVSVFTGTAAERFEVEVLGVLRDLAPQTSYILARLSGHGLEQSGVIAGMSGSPVYLDGRIAGAVAFAFPFATEAIAGITPIEAMRGLGAAASPASPAAPVTSDAQPLTLAELAAARATPGALERALGRLAPPLAGERRSGLAWMASGFAPASLARLEGALGVVGGAGRATLPAGDLAPGGSIAAVLVDGDLRLAATGTLTDRTGDELLAFGHPVMGLGEVEMPLAPAEVVTVIASRYSSFKLANIGDVAGTFDLDRSVGMRGRLGRLPAMVPLTVRVGGDRPRAFAMRLADLPTMLPILTAVGTLGALDVTAAAGGTRSLELNARLAMAGHEPLVLRQSFDGDGAAVDAVVYLLGVVAYLTNNSLEKVHFHDLDVELAPAPQPRAADLRAAYPDHTVVEPGERLRLRLELAPYRGDVVRRDLTITVPGDLTPGRYTVLVGDGASVDSARLSFEPVEPQRLDQALAVIGSFHSRREVVAIGLVPARGVVAGGEPLPRLPGSIQALWAGGPERVPDPLRMAIVESAAMEMEMPVSGLVRIDLEVRRPLGGRGKEPS